MSLNRLFETIDEARNTANWRAAFGEPQAFEDRTVIPVARVRYGFGLGFGSGTGEAEEEGAPIPQGEGGGGGGATSAQPMGAIVVTPDCVYFEETSDTARISFAGILLAGFVVYQVAKTLRVLAGRE